MKKIFLGMLVCMFSLVSANAQIGYQVSLLNSATGEPRANETVNASIVITDSKNATVYSTTQSATTNDFGVLSFILGDANTFKDIAGRLPLYISVTVGGTLIGKSQILNVPVAEVANTLKSDFTLEELCGKEWIAFDYSDGSERSTRKISFNTDGTWTSTFSESDSQGSYTILQNGTYETEGNTIYAYVSDNTSAKRVWTFRFKNSSFYIVNDYEY